MKHALAKALYDNKSEAPDELAFKKGDRIIVIEQNTGGLEGWWLCSLNGRQGIAPGNRLQIIPGVYDNGAGGRFTGSPHKVVTPTFAKTPSHIQSDYDVPPSPRPAGCSSPPSLVSAYDTLPTRHRPAVQIASQDVYDVPPAAKKCMDVSESSSGFEEYDIPRSHSIGSNELYDVPKSFAKEESAMAVNAPDFIEMTYDIPVASKNAVVLNSIHENTHKDFTDGSAKHARQPGVNVYNAPQGTAPDDTYDIPPSHGLTLINASNTSKSSFNGGPSEIYDTPPSRSMPEETNLDLYDTPPNHYPEGLYDTPPSRGIQEYYDTPVAHKLAMMKLNGHQDSVYDIPPQVTKDKPGSLIHPSQRHSVNELDMHVNLNMTTRLSKSVNDLDGVQHGHLNLDRDAAMDLFVQKQQSLEGATANFLSYVCSSWRTRESLSKRLQEIRSASEQVRVAFKDIIDFGNGTLSNAAALPDIKSKITKEFQPLLDSHSTLYKLGITLDEQGWDINKLVKAQAINTADELDQFVLTSRGIHEHLKRLASVISTHSSLLFKRSAISASRPLPPPPSSSNTNWVTAEKEYSPNSKDLSKVRPLPNIPPPLSPKTAPYSKIIMAEKISKPLVLSQHDLEILSYYRGEVESHSVELKKATSMFFTCIEEHFPPKIFVAHSKHVILTGHKLVFIGDTLHHNVQSTELRDQIIHCSDLLCEFLNTGVTATKTAALQFPAVQPLQEMVNKMTEIESAADQLKNSILLNLKNK
ncbi:enhancer of filamentation 1-like isoform X2 [Anneissia japonica]|uniref:enhancer of filamentation 1-like isoform X2 n=1 Tax=Anneissia japonica TaxID=1529436 RepID=UPI0014254B55|nr:enhancer of filamentation 1-like isoform X2 [Anneissia japonica]